MIPKKAYKKAIKKNTIDNSGLLITSNNCSGNASVSITPGSGGNYTVTGFNSQELDM